LGTPHTYACSLSQYALYKLKLMNIPCSHIQRGGLLGYELDVWLRTVPQDHADPTP